MAVANLRTYLQGPTVPPPQPSAAAIATAATLPTPPPASTGYPQGVPITQTRFPPSSSQRPAWLDAPVFSTAPTQPTHYTTGPPAAQPPHFSKLEFATYDGTVDPLNWLNQCDQFFRGQRTLASDRTWIASYHLRGAAQTWYYAPEQDTGGIPPWERFHDLCLLRFGPPIRGSRLAELGRLPFTSSVQDFADRFQTLACHAPGVTARQRANLFVGGLPDHIRVDVEMREPPDLQTATEIAASTLSEAGVTTYGPVDATSFVVSLHALAGIKTPKTMLLPVTINGECLTALVDMGSTHNFLSGATMRRLH
ncbi:uncharacterized protein LOC124655810 [Lolium rigidum]|uniref:uncharacterized protein LOC124655810 n=1 Tax=Lolium rigidum TaxID=89674 RepID=UPI001F5C3943|nr:uncharacterized protein LOC124655810 [Lolium rigidum]